MKKKLLLFVENFSVMMLISLLGYVVLIFYMKPMPYWLSFIFTFFISCACGACIYLAACFFAALLIKFFKRLKSLKINKI